MPDPVIYRITADRGHHQQADQQPDVHRTERCECACCEQREIARQERRHDKTRLHEDDKEKDGSTSMPHTGYDIRHVFIQMQKQIDQKFNLLHTPLSNSPLLEFNL